MPNLDSLKKLINYKNTFVLTLVIFVSLSFVNLIGANALSTQGAAVSEMETKTLKLEKDNQLLSVKIEESTRMQSLEELAQSRGFIRSKNIVFVPTPPTFASR